MGESRFKQVGLDRLVRLIWLEKVSNLVLAGNNAKDIKVILQEELKESFRSSSPDVRGSLDKTITILLKVWLTAPSDLEPFRLEGLEMMKKFSRQQHLAIHWGMIMAVYPFWSSVAIQVGRLLRLQGSAVAIQVQRRVREQYGERETVSRRARYILRSFLDWGVIQESEKKGIYIPSQPILVEDLQLISWLMEASLLTKPNKSAPLKDLLNGPNLFPFKFAHVSAEQIISKSSRLDLMRHSLDDDLILLR